MTGGPERPTPTPRTDVKLFHAMLAIGLIVQGVMSAPYALMSTFMGFGAITALGFLGVAALVALLIAALALLGLNNESKPAAVFLVLAGGFLFLCGYFFFFLASCGSIVNCGTGSPAYGTLTIIWALAALDLVSAIVLWLAPPRRAPAPPQP